MKKLIVIMVISMLSMASYSQTLVNHWPLSTNFNDVVGGKNLFAPPTTPVNNNTPQITPTEGVYFDGNGDWLSGPIAWAPFWGDASLPYGGDTTFMISMWVKIDGSNGDSLYNGSEQFVSIGFQRDVNTNNQITFGAQAHNQNNPGWGFPENGQMAIQTISTNYIRSNIPEPDIITGDTNARPFMKDEWVHLVFNHKSTFAYANQVSLGYPDFYSEYNFDLYKNGEKFPNQTSGSYNPCPQCGIWLQYLTNPTPFPLFSSFAVGAAKDVAIPGTNRFFKGWIKDIQIYIGTGNLALDTVLINSLFNNPPVFTSTSEIKNDFLKVSTYPNPSNTGIFFMETDVFGNNVTYTIMDLSGKMVGKGIINEPKKQIDLSKHSKGMYFVKIEDDSKAPKTIKLIYQ